MKPMYWVLGIIVIVVLVVGYMAKHQIKMLLTGGAAPATQETMQTTPAASADNNASSSATTGQTITIEGNEFAFTPSIINAKMGQAVTVTFKNTGKVAHNFAIADLSVKSKTIQPGEMDTVTFTPSKAGKFTYTCTVDSHADKGMTGTLMVH